MALHKIKAGKIKIGDRLLSGKVIGLRKTDKCVFITVQIGNNTDYTPTYRVAKQTEVQQYIK